MILYFEVIMTDGSVKLLDVDEVSTYIGEAMSKGLAVRSCHTITEAEYLEKISESIAALVGQA